MLVVLAVANFMILLDNTIVTVALPTIDQKLGLSQAQLEWIVSAYALTFGVLMLTGGRLADLLGRKLIFLIGLVTFTCASLACGLAGSGGFLIGARVVQGIGAALMLPATLSIIPATFPKEEQGTAIGIWTGTSGLGVAIGPLVGGVLTESAGWNWVFLVNVPVGIIGAAVAISVIRESKRGARERLDLPGLLTSGVSLFALTFALIESQSYGWGSTTVIALLIVSVIALALFVAVERRRTAPMLDLGLFSSGTFSGANVVSVIIGMAMISVLVFLSIFMQRQLGYSASKTGLAFLPMTLVIIFTAPVVGKLGEKVGPRFFLSAGLVIVAVALLLLTSISADSGSLGLVLRLMLAGIGIGFVMPTMVAAALAAVSPEKSGVVSGLINTSRQLGGAIGIALTGAIIAQVAKDSTADRGTAFIDGLQTALFVAAGIALFGAIVAALTVQKAAVAPAVPADERKTAAPVG